MIFSTAGTIALGGSRRKTGKIEQTKRPAAMSAYCRYLSTAIRSRWYWNIFNSLFGQSFDKWLLWQIGFGRRTSWRGRENGWQERRVLFLPSVAIIYSRSIKNVSVSLLAASRCCLVVAVVEGLSNDGARESQSGARNFQLRRKAWRYMRHNTHQPYYNRLSLATSYWLVLLLLVVVVVIKIVPVLEMNFWPVI